MTAQNSPIAPDSRCQYRETHTVVYTWTASTTSEDRTYRCNLNVGHTESHDMALDDRPCEYPGALNTRTGR